MTHSAQDLVSRLRRPEGESLLAEISRCPPAELTSPRFVAGLRKSWPAELVSLALRVGEARQRAASKYPEGERLFFTPELLEQASAHPPALHRARRLVSLGPVLDLGCGAGGDLSRLALAGATVCGLERDPLAAALARANLEVLGLSGEVYEGTLPEASLPPHRALFADPARREGGRYPAGTGFSGRRQHRSEFSPAPGHLRPLLATAPAWAVKWGPALDLSHSALSAPGALLDGMSRRDYELELVSWRGELREAVLWGGDARRGISCQATVLSGGPEAFEVHEYIGDTALPPPPVATPGPWIIEPDSALIRARLLAAFAREQGCALLAPEIAYLSASAPAPAPLARTWPLLELLPFSLSRLQAALDRHDAGSIVLKKRGFPLDPEELRPRLRLRGKNPLTVLIYREGSGHRICLCGPEHLADNAGD